MPDFARLYTVLLEEYGRPVKSSDAHSEAEVASAEKRLRLKLPRALRDFYLSIGAARDIHDSHNHLANLRMPKNPAWGDSPLNVENGHLYFYDENQRVVLWCINEAGWNSDDPPVMQEMNGAPSERYEECEHVSEFLSGMMYFHLTMGAAPYFGAGEADEERIAALKDSLDFKMDFIGSHIFARSGRILFLTAPRSIQVSARESADFAAIESLLKPAWNFKNSE